MSPHTNTEALHTQTPRHTHTHKYACAIMDILLGLWVTLVFIYFFNNKKYQKKTLFAGQGFSHIRRFRYIDVDVCMYVASFIFRHYFI